MDAGCSLAASLLALDSEAAWELPEPAELPELLWEAELPSLPELLSPEPVWDVLVLVLWEEPDSPLELDVLAEEAVLSLLEAL